MCYYIVYKAEDVGWKHRSCWIIVNRSSLIVVETYASDTSARTMMKLTFFMIVILSVFLILNLFKPTIMTYEDLSIWIIYQNVGNCRQFLIASVIFMYSLLYSVKVNGRDFKSEFITIFFLQTFAFYLVRISK